jgi:hypothetical protein
MRAQQLTIQEHQQFQKRSDTISYPKRCFTWLSDIGEMRLLKLMKTVLARVHFPTRSPLRTRFYARTKNYVQNGSISPFSGKYLLRVCLYLSSHPCTQKWSKE